MILHHAFAFRSLVPRLRFRRSTIVHLDFAVRFHGRKNLNLFRGDFDAVTVIGVHLHVFFFFFGK